MKLAAHFHRVPKNVWSPTSVSPTWLHWMDKKHFHFYLTFFTYTDRRTYSTPGINRRVLRILGVFASLKNSEEMIAISNFFSSARLYAWSNSKITESYMSWLTTYNLPTQARLVKNLHNRGHFTRWRAEICAGVST